jgi:uncharacterized protein YebE (UPF0316 family)
MTGLDALFASPVAGPLLIFGLRIIDVSLGTIRMLLAMRDARKLVPLIAFFETLIWVFAVGNAIRHLDSGWHILGYCMGFATGNAAGLWLEGKLAFGLASIRVITRNGGREIADALRAQGFGATELEGEGREGKVVVVWLVTMRRSVPIVLETVKRLVPDAFVTVEEPRSIERGWLVPPRRK